MDNYIKEKIESIKNAKTNEEIAKILDEIWHDGYDIGIWDADYYYSKFWY